jgi:hypothetical protein
MSSELEHRKSVFSYTLWSLPKGHLIGKLNEVEMRVINFAKTVSMKSISKLLSTVSRWAMAALFCVSLSAFVWQGAFFSSTAAMAAPEPLVIAATDAGDQIQRDNKNFVRGAAEKVKETANKNANRVERATGDNDSFVERKAQRDAARIEQRANEDASRTQRAIDNNVNAVERVVDNIKDAFSK